MEIITTEPPVPTICRAKVEELAARVALFDRGLAALSPRELVLAGSLGIQVDFGPVAPSAV